MKRSRHDDDNRGFLFATGQLSKVERTGQTRNFDYFPKKSRPAGASLKPSDVPALVAKALAGAGPIKQGEAFEHFLAVVCDNYRFHAFHFIIAAPRSVGGRRRAVLLSERTLNGNVEMASAYATRLVEYAAALGNPRVMISVLSFCCDLARCLTRSVPNSMEWADAKVQWPPECESLRGQYQDNYALGFERYKQASATKAIKCPPLDALAGQVAAMSPSIDGQGRVALTRPGDRMDRELEALCLLYLDEERERLAGDPRATLLAG
ncbi:hypothetical protein KVG88_30315 [Pseudomonas sp. SWRI74]|uniref:Uncharacterized protein n=1 Tax=Pseudomonas azerbaijanoccidentalis TaxID=2842347 RepID=A0ABS6QZM1_9PSED|nr:hypothetical protein [Pseudomonas azerbaijanoccidentalis]MBV4524371.1 hypothetical protein [Pseudomonas azerbaijanoccidentalis]